MASIIFSALAIGIVVYKKYHDHNKLGKAWMIASKDLNVINEKSVSLPDTYFGIFIPVFVISFRSI